MGLARAGLFAAAHAVPPGKPSFTADAVCGYRAIAAFYMVNGSDGKPDGRLLNWQRFLQARVP